MVVTKALWVVAALVLAGCAGAVEEEGQEQTSSASERVVDDDAGAVNTTVGRVAGTVISQAGLALQGALVVILSVDNSVTTNRNGSFAFSAVEAGKQTLRVEKENYQTLVQSFTVVAGKKVEIEVVMAPVEGVDPGRLEHFHDHWRGQDTYTVYDDTAEWETEMGDDPLICQGLVGGTVPMDEWSCKYVAFIPEEGRIVPPGTKELHITLDYELPPGAALYGTPWMYLDPPDYECDIGDYCYNTKSVSAEPGKTQVLELEPLWVDHGHATTTGWAFYLYWGNTLPVSGWFWNDLMKSPIDAKIEAIRGGLEIDPPHPRFWQNNDTIALQDTSQYMSCIGCTSYPRSPTVPTRNECRNHCILLQPGDIVPPGATRLEFTFEVTWFGREEMFALYEHWADRFMIGYKTPDIGLKHGTWEDFAWPEPVEVDDPQYGQWERHSIDLEPEHVDHWYDTFSQWMFTFAFEGEPTADKMERTCPVYSACPSPRITLSDIRVFNDDIEE